LCHRRVVSADQNQQPDGGSGGSFFSVEGGEIRSRGVELEAKAALSASVNVVGSYTYTDAEYTTDTNYKGNTPAQVPKHMASCGRLHLLTARCLA
jgi:outer membrane receptor protein involved in Fe transport